MQYKKPDTVKKRLGAKSLGEAWGKMGKAESSFGSWYRLDNTGNLYPSVLTRNNTTLFRLAVALDRSVNVDRLNRSIESVMHRYPYFRVQLRGGAFWYSFVDNPRFPRPVIDSRSPCLYMPFKKRGLFPFRVRAFGPNLAVEFSHALTDGTGALTFLETLLETYFSDYTFSKKEPEKTLLEEEIQDAFRAHYNKRVPLPEQEKKVFHLSGKRYSPAEYRVLTGNTDAEKLKLKAREYGVSVTEFLTAVYFYALQEIQEQTMGKKYRSAWDPISVMVPVNLRKILPSNTMRNFFLTLNPLLDTRLGHYEFEDIAEKVHHFIHTQLDRRHLQQQISRNVKGTIHPLIRIAPLFVKDIALKSIYRDYGESRFSGSISNLGKVGFSPRIEERVKSLHFVPPPSPVLGKKSGVLSYGNTLSITFGSKTKETALERLFFTFLRKEGLPVFLKGNLKGEE